MTISLREYESAFVRYADGELSPAEMQEVEAFCERYPKLAAELKLLKEARLQPRDAWVFSGKERLMRPVLWSAEGLNSEQLHLLERHEATHPSTLNVPPDDLPPQLLREWELLNACRLSTEPCSMPGKKKLLHAAAWPTDNLSSRQEQMLDAFEAGMPMPEWAAGDLFWMKEWECLQRSRLQLNELQMPDREKLLKHPAEVVLFPGIRPFLRFTATAAAVVMLVWGTYYYLISGNSNAVTKDYRIAAENVPGKPDAKIPEPAPLNEDPINVLPKSALRSDVAFRPAAKKPSANAAAGRLPAAGLRPEPVPASEPEVYETNPADKAALIAAYRLEPDEEHQVKTRIHQLNALGENHRRNLASTMPALPVAAAEPTAWSEEWITEESEYIQVGISAIPKQKLRQVFRAATRKIVRTLDRKIIPPPASGIEIIQR